MGVLDEAAGIAMARGCAFLRRDGELCSEANDFGSLRILRGPPTIIRANRAPRFADGVSPWGAFAFGGVFVTAGMLIILVGAKVIAVNSKGVHAPYWVLTVFGAVFVLAGMMVWGMAWKQHTANRRRAEVLQRYAGEAAFADYAWDPARFRREPLAASGESVGRRRLRDVVPFDFQLLGVLDASAVDGEGDCYSL